MRTSGYQLTSQLSPGPLPVRSHATNALRRRGLGDFASDLAGSPAFQQGWASLEKQIQAENKSQGGSAPDLANQINGAKTLYENAFQGLIGSYFDAGAIANGSAYSNASQAASQLVATGATVLGAVKTISGLVNAAENGTPTEVVQAFSGVMIGLEGIGVASGVLTAGAGAAICAGIALVGAILDDILSSPPTTAIGNCQVDNSALPRWTVGLTFPVPSATNQTPVTGGPGSPKWRKFPVASLAKDAWWFLPVSISASLPLFGGSAAATSSPFTTPAPGWQSGTSVDQWVSCGGEGVRPIDAAFPVYHQLECDIAAANATLSLDASAIGEVAVTLAQFTKAYYAAWSANNEYALNGLGKNLQPDATVLVQVANHWNNAHAPGVGVELAAPSSSSSGSQAIDLSVPCSSATPANAYIRLLVGDLQNQSGSGPNSILTNGTTLHLNTGPLYAVSDVGGVLLMNNLGALFGRKIAPAAMSTGTKVVIGAVSVLGVAATGTALYAYLTKQAVRSVLEKAWDKTGGRAIHSLRK
jgi:hypothetical protein